jgi:DGQHR domain-containing protein
VIDGQHRLYGYSLIEKKLSKQNLVVIAFEALRREDEANLFVTINHEQKTVPRTLLDELDADLKWGSSKPAERLSSIAARVVQALGDAVGGPVFRRIVAQGLKADDTTCLTVPEIKGGIVRSQLIGHLAQKRRMIMQGAFTGHDDSETVLRATDGIALFLIRVRSANSNRWDAGRPGGLSTNTGVRGLLLLLAAFISHVEKASRIKAPDLAVPEVIQEIEGLLQPLLIYLRDVPEQQFLERFTVKYGSGGPREYFFELAEVVHQVVPEFRPDGLEDYLESKNSDRVAAAEANIKYFENKITDIIVSKFKALHGDKYWDYIGSKDMRVKAYERQQEEPVEKRLPLEAYLDLIDKKKIIEKSDWWTAFKPYFDIQLPGEKGYAKNLHWIDRLNELRRIVAHPHARRFRREDLEFLEWLRPEFDRRIVEASGSEHATSAKPGSNLHNAPTP